MPLHSHFQTCLPKPKITPPQINNNSNNSKALTTHIHPSNPPQQSSTSLSTSLAPSPITLPSSPLLASPPSNPLLLSPNHSAHSKAANLLHHPDPIKVPIALPTHLPTICPHATPATSHQIQSELLQENTSSSSLRHYSLLNSESNLQLSVDGLKIVNQHSALQHSNPSSETNISGPNSINFDLLDYRMLALLEQKLAEGALADHSIHDTLSGTAGIDPRLLSINNPSTSTFGLPTTTEPVSPVSMPHLSNLETSAPSNQHQTNTAENPSTLTTGTPSNSPQHSPSQSISSILSSDNNNDNDQIPQHTHNEDEFASNNSDADAITTSNSPLCSPSVALLGSSFSDNDNDNNKIPQDTYKEDELGSNDPDAEGITDDEGVNSSQNKLNNKVFSQLSNTFVNLNHDKGNTTAA